MAPTLLTTGLPPLLALLIAATAQRVACQDGFTNGRATWFDVGTLSAGNCHFDSVSTTINGAAAVGALPDAAPGFDSSCGTCYEVKCRDDSIVDGYGARLDRSNACYDQSKTVVITIADACPCSYPNNQYSNRRWCCGDMAHMDVGREVFEQLADPGVGVIGLSWRQVSCDTPSYAGNGAASGGSSSSNPSWDSSAPALDSAPAQSSGSKWSGWSLGGRRTWWG